MNRIMLRFRPIAPKPAAGVTPSAAADQEKRNGAVKSGRRIKRKYVTVRDRQSTKRKPTEEGRLSPPEKAVVTLQLLPERSESQKSCCCSSSALKFEKIVDRVGDEVNHKSNGGGTAATWIVVECVTDTYVEGGVGLGFSDGEMIRNLQADTCPGFVSDGANNVVRVNDAYRRMAAEKGVLVLLVVREKLPYFTPSFACRVRMIQQTKHGQKWNRIAACDVWRMEFSGFAWKLDVETALGLGI